MPRPRSRRFAGALALAAAPLGGCFSLCQPSFPDPCDMDPLGCEGADQLSVDPKCGLSGELMVEVGDGESVLVPFTDGSSPTIHNGAQGGQHMVLGVRVGDPAKDFPGLDITFTVESGPCAVDDLECARANYASRHLVVTDADLWTIDGGHLDTTGYIVLLDGNPGWANESGWTRVFIRAEVRDRCGRTGVDEYAYVIGSEPTTGSESDASTSDASTSDASTSDASTSDASTSG